MFEKHKKDRLIEYIRELLRVSFNLDFATLDVSLAHVERLIAEHYEGGGGRLQQIVPNVGTFHTPLKLVEAFHQYDAKYRVTARLHVAPSFNDVRHILNLAQINAIGDGLRLLTLDGDCTLYSDGKCFEDPKLCRFLCLLLCHGVTVALVTAAGYGYNVEKYTERIGYLLRSFEAHGVPVRRGGAARGMRRHSARPAARGPTPVLRAWG